MYESVLFLSKKKKPVQTDTVQTGIKLLTQVIPVCTGCTVHVVVNQFGKSKSILANKTCRNTRQMLENTLVQMATVMDVKNSESFKLFFFVFD